MGALVSKIDYDIIDIDSSRTLERSLILSLTRSRKISVHVYMQIFSYALGVVDLQIPVEHVLIRVVMFRQLYSCIDALVADHLKVVDQIVR